MGYENTGQLTILGWRDGALIDMASIGERGQYLNSVTAYHEASYICDTPVPRDITWEFSNIDSDDAQEILQHQTYLDNWQCIIRITKVIDWNGIQDRYVQIDESRDFPEDSQNCARRQAEEAMWAGQYEQALGHYERALALPPYIDPDENNSGVGEYYQDYARNRRITYDQYHIARMALAYQLTGQPEKARPILESLSQQEFSNEPMQYFVQALIAAPDTPVGACLAAYTTFAQHYRTSSPIYLMGVTQEQAYNNSASYSPARIGCDVQSMLANELNNQTLTPDSLPEELLNDLGVPTREVIQADLNGDGQDEWLVWPESPMNPFFFTLSDDNRYVVSTPAVDPFGHADEVHLQSLPDEAGTAVAYLTQDIDRYYSEPWACVYNAICGMDGHPAKCSPEGFSGLTIWRMEALALIPILTDVDVCRTDFDALFPREDDNTQIDGGELIWVEQNRSQLIRYRWQAMNRIFVEISTQAEPTLVPTPLPTPEPQYRYFGEALDAGDYAAALIMLDASTPRHHDYYRENPDALYAYQYQRAFILEALNRSDEALAEYIAIYEAAPESSWGMLAGLHFEASE